MTTGSFAFFKLPGSIEYVSVRSAQGRQLPETLEDMRVEPGFAVFPFCSDGNHVPFLIPAEDVQVRKIPDSIPCGTETVADHVSSASDYPLYSQEFERFHKSVRDGSFRKLVLARGRSVHLSKAVDYTALFLRACVKYPHAMVMMFHRPGAGIWLCASPEPLLRYCDGEYRTVALAGTMPYGGSAVPSADEWDAKNRDEQQVVCNFIRETLSPFADLVHAEGPYTFQAGNLLHLRTDISFRAAEDRLWAIASALHPTPAVCGFPQESAKTFIRENERQSRGYYSGFAGPVAMGGRTDLFVNLRSACISDDGMTASLYAGGGIMKDSSCRSEYEETIHKMQTIAGIF